jgi:hypothetical protein
MKTVVKTTAKKPVKAAVKTASKVARASTGSALRGAAMTSQELHESMLAYGKKVTATKASARAFLKRIGAPV